jgi:hypothetical protein
MVVGMTPPRIDGRNYNGIEGKCHAGWKSVHSRENGLVAARRSVSGDEIPADARRSAHRRPRLRFDDVMARHTPVARHVNFTVVYVVLTRP